MPQFTNEEKTEMILIYGECRRNSRLASRVYTERFPNRRCPDHKIFASLQRNLQIHGSFIKPKRNRNRPVTSDMNSNVVLNFVNQNPHASVVTIACEAEISSTSVRRILKKHTYHNYKMILVQELLPADYEQRLNFIAMMSVIRENNYNFLNLILWSDESQFTNNGRVNRHNLHYWSSENPKWLRQRNFQRVIKVNVWCGIIGRYLIGPYFFENNLNSERYVQFLQNELPILLEDLPLETRLNMWFQQDGAPPHNGNNVTNYLNETFPDKWIGRFGPIHWPARSPDITPLDYFLWGYLKHYVYQTRPTDMDDLKNRIKAGCATIRGNLLEKVVNSELIKRYNFCIARNGGNFEQDL